MTVRTISPSGDTRGVTDTATVAAAVALMGAGDELVLRSGYWYFLPAVDGFIINATANNQTFTFGTSDWCYVSIVGKGAATTSIGIINVLGFTGITIRGVTNSAGESMSLLDGGRAAIVAGNSGGELLGGCIGVSNHAVWGSDNAIVIRDLKLKDGFLNGYQLNSVYGATITNVTSWATSSPTDNSSNSVTGPGHGNDMDAVVLNKPCQNISFVNCDIDAYNAECTKMENSVSITYTNCIFRQVITFGQDNGDCYDQLGPVTFTGCTFYGPVRFNLMKRRGVAASNKPAANLTLGSAAIGATTCTASAAVFAAGDVNKYIAAIGSSGTLGFAQITGFTDSTHVNITNIQTWASTSVTSQTWTLGSVDQGGSGAVTFSGCTLAGDAAVFAGLEAIAANYGTVTITNCTEYDDDGVVGGGNTAVFPTGVTVTQSGNNGWRNNVLHYVLPKPPAKISTAHYGNAGLNGVYSYASKWMAAQTIGAACTAGLSSAGDEIVVMDGTYWSVAGTNDQNNSYDTNGNRSIFPNGVAITIRAKHKWRAIVDGTGGPSGATPFGDSTSTQGAEIRGFKVANWTTGNNIGCSIPAGTSSLRVRDMWFYNISNTNGGAGIRIASSGAPLVDNCLFTLCSTTGTGGGGLYTSAVNGRYTRLYFDTCTTSVQMGGAIRFDFASTALFPVVGVVAVNCSATGTANGGGIGGRNFTLAHYTAVNNTSAAATPAADLYTTGGTNVLKNSICRSTTPISTNAAATLQYSYNNYASAPTGGGTNTDQGNNSTTDPGLTGGYRLPSASAVGYRSGTVVEHGVDMDGNQRYAPPSLGAYELLGARSASSTRTAATTRTAYSGRKLRGYP